MPVDDDQRQDPVKGFLVMAEVWAEANQGICLLSIWDIFFYFYSTP